MTRKQIIKHLISLDRVELIHLAKFHGLTNLDASNKDLAVAIWSFGYRLPR